MQIYNDDIKIIYHQTKNPLNLYIITMMIYWWYHKPWAPPLQSLMGPNWTLCARNILEPWNHAEKYGKDGESLRVGRGKHVGFPHDFNRRILDDFDVPRKNALFLDKPKWSGKSIGTSLSLCKSKKMVHLVFSNTYEAQRKFAMFIHVQQILQHPKKHNKP